MTYLQRKKLAFMSIVNQKIEKPKVKNLINIPDGTYFQERPGGSAYLQHNPNPPVEIKPNTDYTLAFDFYDVTHGPIRNVFIGVGRGTTTSNPLTISISSKKYPETFVTGGSGRVVFHFNSGSFREQSYFGVRPVACWDNDAYVYVRWKNVMLVEGTYTEETMPDYVPYEV